MYFWNSYPFVRLSIALIVGIIFYDSFSSYWTYSYQVLTIGLVLLSISILVSSKWGFFKLRHLNGVLMLLMTLFLGGYMTKMQYHDHLSSHYSFIEEKIEGFSGTIVSTVNERTNHYRYDFELDRVKLDSSEKDVTSGIIHLYVKKDSIKNTSFAYGDQLLVKGSFYPVPGPDNPNEFDYKKYLEHQNIYSHSFVSRTEIKLIDNSPPNRYLKWAFKLRNSAVAIIDNNIPEPRENGISKALLLGIKDHLDNDIKKSYSAAGAMHVLAVSGLHVGIIYMIIQVFIGKLRSKGKIGKLLFGVISVVSIWFYATITGLSPSVLRAATMFSLVAVSQMFTKEGNIYNTLGFAGFVLLLFDPYLIYSVGFQLSFAAVVGIVYLQPKIYRLVDFNNWLIDKAWAITCVSIAAQLATFPLSAYYFHQFPTYFLFSNLVVIPSAFVMLISGMAMLAIDSIFHELGLIIGQMLYYFMWVVNELISLVDIMPNSLIEWIYMDKVGLIMTYLIVITTIAGLHYRSFKTLIMTTIAICFLISWNFISNKNQSKKHELIFFEIRNKIVIDHRFGHLSKLYLDEFSPEELELLSFQINPSRLSSHLQPISQTIKKLELTSSKDGALKYGKIEGLKLLVFDSTTFHLNFIKPIESDIVILNNNSVKNLEWLTKNVRTKNIIIGNRNSSYYSRKIKSQAKELNLAIHSLKEDGSLTITL